MNKLRTIALTLVAALWLGLPAMAAAGTQDFTIPTFDADYTLSRDSDRISHLTVKEHIVAQFPDFDQNHGILRAIPDHYEAHSLNLQIQSVTDDTGRSLAYTTSSSNNNRVLKIGDSDRYVHGLQTYNIAYSMDNVTTGGAGYNGFFWDVNGDQWQQVFGQVTARLHLASDLAAAVQPDSVRCFTGPRGSTAQACTVTPGDDGLTTFTATRPLTAAETLTIETRFAEGTFAAYHLPASELISRIAYVLGLYVIPISLTLLIALRQWRRHGRDPEGRGVIIPEYLPPADLSVIGSGIVLKESFQPQSISAQIIDLAVRHYLKIYEVESKGLFINGTTYEIELIKAPTGLRSEEAATITMLYGASPAVGARINLDSLKNKLYKQAGAIGDDVTAGLVTAGSLANDPAKAKIPYISAGIGLILVSFFFLPHTIGLIICAVILFIAAQVMPARTAKGVAQREYLLGLKQYMTVAEAERLKVLQSPHGELTEKVDVTDTTQLVKLYERLLPFAMLMGIEKDWAKQFAGLYQQPPEWYSGSSSFNAGYFAGAMAGFGTASTASFSAPSSSSGGGSAGGGGGGGGGGGW